MPLIKSTNQYSILHDQNLPLCFVGNNHYSDLLVSYFNNIRHCIKVTLEELEEQTTQWRDRYQFICLSTHPMFKQRAKQVFDRLNLRCFSVIANMASIGNNVNVGYNVMIDQYVYIWDDCVIGNFTTVSCNVIIAHGTNIGEGCHMSPYCHLAYTKCGNYVFVGNGSFLFANAEKDSVSIADFVNLQAFSRVINTSIDNPGTYYSTRQVDARTSIELSL